MKKTAFFFFIFLVFLFQPSFSQTQNSDSLTNIGFGEILTEDVSSSIVTVNENEFNPGLNITPIELIIGKTPGVLITRESGTPGGYFNVTIRGISTLFGNNSPMYVVDGIPLNYRQNEGMRKSLNFINPGDIESFTILKDAAASAIFGGQASNGVILITTKKGTANKPLSINYEGKFSLSTARKRNVFTADEFRSLVQADGTTNDIAMLGDANTNWQDEIYQNAFGQDQLLSISGGIKNLPYRVSIGYTNQDGVLKTDNLNRLTGALNLNPRFFKNHLGIGFGMNGMRTTNQFADQGAIPGAVAFDPTQPVYENGNENEGYFYWKDENGDPNLIAPKNPLALLELTSDIAQVSKLFYQFNIDYKIHGLPELDVAFNFSQDWTKSERNVSTSKNAPWNYNNASKSYQHELKTNYVDFLLSYNKMFKKSNSNLEAVAGVSGQSFSNFENSYSGFYNYENELMESFRNYATENSIFSFFARANFSLKQKYLIGITFRRDGSSIYAEDNRWSNYPAVSIGWNIHDEEFLSESKILSILRLRASYGKTGNMNLSYNYCQNNYYSGQCGYNVDARLKPESTASFNVGIDYGFINNRLSGSVDFYSRHSTDVFNLSSVPVGTNLTNYILVNAGEINNSGIEFSIDAELIKKANFYWEMGYNISWNKNKIEQLSPLSGNIYTGNISGGVGNTIQVQSVGYPAYSFYVLEQIYDEQGNPVEGAYVDQNNDDMANYEDRYQYKSASPNVFMGIFTSLNVNNWDFSLLGTIRMGNDIYNNIDSKYGAYGQLSPTANYLNALSPNINQTQFETNQYFSNYYVRNASYFKLNNLMVGYNFKPMMKRKWGIRVYATAQNLFTISGYDGPEPEIVNGIDYNTYATPRIYMLGVSVGLN